jgi:hypothetical protein
MLITPLKTMRNLNNKSIHLNPYYGRWMDIELGCFQWILDFIVDRIPLPTTEKKMQQVNFRLVF